jgi:Ca2+-binding RTX toxin-like protein
MTTASYSVELDRDSTTFNLLVTYDIPVYNDPESGQSFSETSWTAAFGVGGSTGATGAGSSETVSLNIGFDPGEGVHQSLLVFTAQNTFSASGFTDIVTILNAGLSHTNQTLTGTAGFDILVGGYANDQLRGFGDNDILDGGAGADFLIGGDGADRLNGGSGNDSLVGGTGDDTYWVDSALDRITERALQGTDTVYSSVSYTLSAEVENLILAGGNLDGTGNASANTITGTAGDNRLVGSAGNDILNGLGGVDTLIGDSENDTLDGGTGDDRMEGGAGNDTYYVDSRLDRVIELGGGGMDTIRVGETLRSYALGANVEALITLGTGPFTGTGNDDANSLTGGVGNDALIGKAGNDRLEGGGGNDVLIGGTGGDQLLGGAGLDTARYADSAAAVSVNLMLGMNTSGDAQGDILTDIENLAGSRFGDTLTGNLAANVLSGGEGDDQISGSFGNDLIVGGAGADQLDGGFDIDTVAYFGSTAVTVNLALGTASGGHAQGDTIVGFENVIGGDGNDVISGDGGRNVLVGGNGNDTIRGGNGNDTILGGAGVDTLDGEGGTNTLSYAGSLGAVTVNLLTMHATGGDAAGDHIAGFDNAVGGSGADTLVGDGGSNALIGAAGNDTLNGAGGADYIAGGAGSDVLIGGAGSDTVSYAGSGSAVAISLAAQTASGGDAAGDTLSSFENAVGGTAGDTITGSAGANLLIGGGGSDFLNGGVGNDRLIGNADADTFDFSRGYDRDVITDFAKGEDLINLHDLGAAFDTVSEVLAAGRSVGFEGKDTLIDFGGGDILVLLNVTLASLTASDFDLT